MAADSRRWFWKKRTWLAVAMGAGVLIGAKFPWLFQGFGGGGGASLFGAGASDAGGEVKDGEARTQTVSLKNAAEPDQDEIFQHPPTVVEVVIAERSIALRTPARKQPVEVGDVVELVQRAAGDADGIRLRIYREPSSRPSVETALQKALTTGGIREHEVLWVPIDVE